MNINNFIIRLLISATIVNLASLIKKDWEVEDPLTLYQLVKHIFIICYLQLGKKRQFEIISWKKYECIVSKINGRILVEVFWGDNQHSKTSNLSNSCSICLSWEFTITNRLELPGNYPVFNVLMVIFHCVERICKILVTPGFCITYTIMKNIIQVNQLIFIYNH